MLSSRSLRSAALVYAAGFFPILLYVPRYIQANGVSLSQGYTFLWQQSTASSEGLLLHTDIRQIALFALLWTVLFTFVALGISLWKPSLLAHHKTAFVGVVAAAAAIFLVYVGFNVLGSNQAPADPYASTALHN